MRYCFFAICLLRLANLAGAAEPSIDPDPLSGRIISAKITQVIGRFNSFGFPEAGDTFELDLEALPTEKLILQQAEGDRDTHYIPFVAPLKLAHVQHHAGSKRDFATIHITSSDPATRFRVHILARGRTKGSTVTIRLYEADDFIGSMAEAEGTLK